MCKSLKIALLLLVLAVTVQIFPSASFGALQGTKEERVNKFRNSLGEQVVRDREKPPDTGKNAFMIRAGLWLAGAVVLLSVLQFTLVRLRSKRVEEETVVRYLTENLMTPSSVHDHLERVLAERTPIFVWIDDHFIKFSSRGETLDTERDVLSILPLTPATGNDMIRSSSRIRIEYMYQKVPYHFECVWKEEQADMGTFFHLVSLPEKIGFIQRREAYRIDPPLSAPLVCISPDTGDDPLSVMDIGMGGFSAGSPSRLRSVDDIPICSIEGETLLPVEASAKCVYEQELPEGKSVFRWRYGFRFTRFGEGNERRLSQYVAAQQGSDLSRRKEMEQ